MNNPKDNTTALIKSSAAKYGLDDDSSSIVIANLGDNIMPMCQGQALTTDEMNTDDFHVIIFGLDASPSMADVIDDVRDAFNEDVIPGLQEASELVGSIRVGGFMFADTLRPLWGGGFYPLSQLPKLGSEYKSFGSSTALNQAALTAGTATLSHALEILNRIKSRPDVTIGIFSDGANRVPTPTQAEVYRVFHDFDPKKITTDFVFFQTWENVRVDALQIARQLGFRNIMNIKSDDPNETLEDKRRRLRHGLSVFSQRLSGSVSKTKVSKADDVGGVNVWTD